MTTHSSLVAGCGTSSSSPWSWSPSPTAVALWIAAGANPKEVAARAGHASVSFTLDRYGHLYPEADTALRDRLDALYGTTQPASAGTVVHLSQRPGRGPSVAPGASGDDKSAADDAPTTL